MQTGSGATTIAVASSYSGGTTVSAGALIVNNIIGSATGTGSVSATTGTIFGGSVAPTGTSGVSLDGSVSPGVSGTTDGVGTLKFTTVDGDVKFESTSSIFFQLRSNDTNGLSLTYNADVTINTVARCVRSYRLEWTGGELFE